jgi:dTDP-4-amino-4,6-dideoxygalactose transaminase
VTPIARTPMSVPLLDLKPQYAEIASEVRAAIERVCASQHFILGAEVKALEERIARYSGARHAIGVSSGTDALLLALMALGIGRGDEVITSPFTFFATAGTIARAGARPLFCDIDPESFNLSPERVAEFIERECEARTDGNGPGLVNRRTGGRIRAIMPVHLYGQLCDMEPLMQIARRHGLKVIEDAAQSLGAHDGARRMAGSIGDVGCYSFFPTKNLGAFGDAGMCVTSDAALAQRMEILRVHGAKPKYYHAYIGGNFRLDEIQAAVLNVKLEYLDDWAKLRQLNAHIYTEALAQSFPRGGPTAPPIRGANHHVFNQYVIRASRRDELRAALTAAGIGSEIYYPVPLHLQECFAYLGHRAGDFPESERATCEVLALPVYPELSEPQLKYVVATIAGFYAATRPPE